MAHLNAKPDRQRKRYDDQEHGEANHEVAQTAPFDWRCLYAHTHAHLVYIHTFTFHKVVWQHISGEVARSDASFCLCLPQFVYQ